MKDDTKWFLEEVLLKEFEEWYENECGFWSKKGFYIDEKASEPDVFEFLVNYRYRSHKDFKITKTLTIELYKVYSKKYDEEHI